LVEGEFKLRAKESAVKRNGNGEGGEGVLEPVLEPA